MQTELFLSSMKHGLMVGTFSDGKGTLLGIIERPDINMYDHLER